MLKASISYDSTGTDKTLAALLSAVTKAADAAGKVYEAGYKAAVPVHNPPGTYGSAGARHHFINLVNAIDRRTFQFRDQTGAYSVVGVKAAPGKWQPLAPQGHFLEFGTDERERKSDGQETGFGPAYHILQSVVERYISPANNTFQSVMKRELER